MPCDAHSRRADHDVPVPHLLRGGHSDVPTPQSSVEPVPEEQFPHGDHCDHLGYFTGARVHRHYSVLNVLYEFLISNTFS